MARLSIMRAAAIAAFLGSTLALVGACDSNSSSSKTSSTPNPNGLAPGEGYCMDTCTKDCTRDDECDMSAGEFCCNLGSAGKTCMKASQCPQFCDLDADCDVATGEACMQVSLSISEKVCTIPSAGVRTCTTDTTCNTGEVCCGIYDKSVCMPPNACPKSCAASSECDTANSEICCTTAKLIEPHLKVDGLCLNPAYQACPKSCTQSTDCNTTTGELCCDGICQTSCQKTCKESADCRNQLCCKSAVTRLPNDTVRFSTGPRCTGTPSYSCASSNCSQIQGCTPPASGTCVSYTSYSCSSMTSSSECAMLPGCTYSGGGTGACTSSGLGFYCSDLYDSLDCPLLPGCSWNASAAVCAGTPTACTSFTSESTCDTSPNCLWSSSGGCSGTPTSCSSFTNGTACEGSYNCNWSASGTCGGSPTPCSQLSASRCSAQNGCYLTTSG